MAQQMGREELHALRRLAWQFDHALVSHAGPLAGTASRSCFEYPQQLTVPLTWPPKAAIRIHHDAPRLQREGPRTDAPKAGPGCRSSTGVTFTAGVLAGLAVDVPLHPLDTIKTRLQAPDGFAASGGCRGLSAGLSLVLIRSVPCSAFFFVAYERLQQCLGSVAFCARSPAWRDAVAGATANTAACVIRVPCEVLKQRLQVAQASGALRAAKPTLRSVTREVTSQGARGLYAGAGATVGREATFALIQMPLFESLRRMHPWSSDTSKARQGAVGMTCGGAAGAVAGALTTPLDVIKTQAMLATEERSLRVVAREVWLQDGPRTFIRGAVPRTAYVGLSCALSFGAFEWSRSVLGDFK